MNKKKYRVLILDENCIILTTPKDLDITNVTDYIKLMDLSPLAFTVGNNHGFSIKLSNGAAKKKSKSPFHKPILGIHILNKELFTYAFDIQKEVSDNLDYYLNKFSLTEDTIEEINSICTSKNILKKNYTTIIEINDIDLSKLPLYNMSSTNIEELTLINF